MHSSMLSEPASVHYPYSVPLHRKRLDTSCSRLLRVILYRSERLLQPEKLSRAIFQGGICYWILKSCILPQTPSHLYRAERPRQAETFAERSLNTT